MPVSVTIRYDREADAASIYFVRGRPGEYVRRGTAITIAERSEDEENLGIELYYSNVTGRLISIEVLGAGSTLPDEVLAQADIIA